jgi:predicted transcriptional regulator
MQQTTRDVGGRTTDRRAARASDSKSYRSFRPAILLSLADRSSTLEELQSRVSDVVTTPRASSVAQDLLSLISDGLVESETLNSGRYVLSVSGSDLVEAMAQPPQ